MAGAQLVLGPLGFAVEHGVGDKFEAGVGFGDWFDDIVSDHEAIEGEDTEVLCEGTGDFFA